MYMCLECRMLWVLLPLEAAYFMTVLGELHCVALMVSWFEYYMYLLLCFVFRSKSCIIYI